MERATGFEPATASLEGWNSTTELRPPLSCMSFHVCLENNGIPLLARINAGVLPTFPKMNGGQARIRTLEADGSRFTVCPLCPLGYLPVFKNLSLWQYALNSFTCLRDSGN